MNNGRTLRSHAAFRDKQRRFTAGFRAYRCGDHRYLQNMHALDGAMISRIPHPSVSSLSDIDHMIPAATPMHLQHQGHGFRANHRNSISGLSGPSYRRRYVRTEVNVMARRLFGVGIRFRRVLSCGGMGLAALFEAINPTTGLFNKVVAKVALKARTEDVLKNEKKWTKLLKNAPHIVQLRTVNELRAQTGGDAPVAVDGVMPQAPPDIEPTDRAKAAIDGADGVMLLEYMPFGSLDHWIGKAAALNTDFSEQACWRMLLCLAKACFSMKQPPSRRAVPARPNLVHFDLDPSNVLVDGSDLVAGEVGGRSDLVESAESAEPTEYANALPCRHEHGLKLKVADLGLATPVNRDFRRRKEKLWSSRYRGKLTHLAPEQWTAEWDAVVDNPLTEGAVVAGQYGEKTNVYHVGLVMLCMMIHKRPENAPRMMPVMVRDWTHATYPSDRGLGGSMGADVPRRRVDTLAWPLYYSNRRLIYEWRLCELVMRCTAYLPSERPSVDELLQLVEERIDEGFYTMGVTGRDERSFVTAANMPQEPQPLRAYNEADGAVDESRGSSDGSGNAGFVIFEDPNETEAVTLTPGGGVHNGDVSSADTSGLEAGGDEDMMSIVYSS